MTISTGPLSSSYVTRAENLSAALRLLHPTAARNLLEHIEEAVTQSLGSSEEVSKALENVREVFPLEVRGRQHVSKGELSRELFNVVRKQDADLQTVVYLFDLGADVNARDGNGNTPLHIVAVNGNEELGKLLLQRGAKVDAKNNDGDEPLHFASANDEKGMVELLKSHGAKW